MFYEKAVKRRKYYDKREATLRVESKANEKIEFIRQRVSKGEIVRDLVDAFFNPGSQKNLPFTYFIDTSQLKKLFKSSSQ